MARFDYARMVKKADKLIQRFGQPKPAKLRRGTTDRNCSAVMIEFTTREKELRAEGARRILVSTLDPLTGRPIVPPDFEQDLIVFNGEVNRIVSPDTGPRPGGTIIYHDLEVVYDSRDV